MIYYLSVILAGVQLITAGAWLLPSRRIIAYALTVQGTLLIVTTLPRMVTP